MSCSCFHFLWCKQGKQVSGVIPHIFPRQPASMWIPLKPYFKSSWQGIWQWKPRLTFLLLQTCCWLAQDWCQLCQIKPLRLPPVEQVPAVPGMGWCTLQCPGTQTEKGTSCRHRMGQQQLSPHHGSHRCQWQLQEPPFLHRISSCGSTHTWKYVPNSSSRNGQEISSISPYIYPQ